MTALRYLAILALCGALAPVPALAQRACESTHSPCPEGQSWDAATQSCIIPLNS